VAGRVVALGAGWFLDTTDVARIWAALMLRGLLLVVLPHRALLRRHRRRVILEAEGVWTFRFSALLVSGPVLLIQGGLAVVMTTSTRPVISPAVRRPVEPGRPDQPAPGADSRHGPWATSHG